MGVFRMPSLGSDMEAGTLAEWLVRPGDTVARGDVVAVVETQKGAIEVEIFESGRVRRLLVDPGDTVPVGTPLAEIGEAGREAGTGPPARPSAPPATETQEAAAPAGASPPAGAVPRAGPTPPVGPKPLSGGAAPSSPAARVRAREAGLELDAIAGSGPGGAVLLADVERALGQAAPLPPQAGPAGVERARAPGDARAAMRQAIAAAMARSKREIPHYYLAHEIDLETAARWLAATNAERPPAERLLMGLMLVRATALSAREIAGFNGTFEDGAFRPAGAVHAGVAVSLRGGGLVAPALHDADSRPLDALMEAMRDLVSRARTGRLRSSEMADPTLTVSSLGERGVDSLAGVIFPPQVALVGFGTPRPRVVPHSGGIAVRTTLTATLAADHRASDGRTGARFLAAIAERLQHPEAL